MVQLRFRYVIEDVDRHGNVRVYFRRKGEPKIRLPGLPGSDEFMIAYRDALKGELQARPTLHSRKPRAPHGTFRWLCEDYFRSAEFKHLDPRTQRVRRVCLDKICTRNGGKQIASIEPRHILQLRDSLAETPAMANSTLKTMRQILMHAVLVGALRSNPAREVAYLRWESEGFHTWTDAEIRRFEEHFPIGTKARLAFALALNLGQRRSDVISLGRQHLNEAGNALHFSQFKNRSKRRVTLQIPVLPELRAALAAAPVDKLQFLVTEFGKPFTSNGFGNRFRKWCKEAGLPHCSIHGLRKTTATRLADAGCTESEIMAITGHRTSKEVVRYTRAANQRVLAERAMSKLTWAGNENGSVPLSDADRSGGTLLGRKSLKKQRRS